MTRQKLNDIRKRCNAVLAATGTVALAAPVEGNMQWHWREDMTFLLDAYEELEKQSIAAINTIANGLEAAQDKATLLNWWVADMGLPLPRKEKEGDSNV